MGTENIEYELKSVSSSGAVMSDAELSASIAGEVKDADDAVEKILRYRKILAIKVKNHLDEKEPGTLQPGNVINCGNVSYKIEKYLSSGGFGITYLAETGEKNQYRVIKEFCPKDDNLDRYKNSRHQDFHLVELQPDMGANKTINEKVEENKIFISKFIKEPNRLEPYFETFQGDKNNLKIVYSTTNAFIDGSNGNLYYAMSTAYGKTLKEFMSERKENMPFPLAMDIMKNIIEGIRPLHEIGIVHQDLSHSNIMVDVTNNKLQNLKVIDLGSAFDMSKGSHNNTMKLTRSAGFMDSKETKNSYFKNNIEWGRYMDIYSLGAILFYLFFYKEILNESENNPNNIEETLDGWLISGADLFKMIEKMGVLNEMNIQSNSQIHAIIKLVEDSISLDKYYKSNGKDNPFHRRPATLDEFSKRLIAIENIGKQIETLNVEITNDLQKETPVDNLEINQVIFMKKDDWFDAKLVKQTIYVQPEKKNEDTSHVRSGLLQIYDGNNQLYQVTVTQTAATVLEWHEDNQDCVEVPFAGGTKNIYIKTNKNWTAAVDEQWVTVKTSSGNAGDKVICEIEAERNDALVQHEATLTITCVEDGTSITKKLKQLTEEPYIDIINSDGLTSVGYGDNNKKTVVLKSNFDWTAKVEYDSNEPGQTWVGLDRQEGSPKDTCIHVTIGTNHGQHMRKAAIVLSTKDNKSKKIDITQTGRPQKQPEPVKPAVQRSDITLIEKKETKGNMTVIFDATSIWNVDMKSLPEWIKVSPLKGEKGKQSITIKPLENKGGPREAEIKVTCGGDSIFIPVSQKGKTTGFKWLGLAAVILAFGVWMGLNPDGGTDGPALRLMNMPDRELDVSYDAEDIYIAFEAGDNWNCEILPSDADWLSVDRTAGTEGQTTLKAAVKTNRKFHNRQATLSLICRDTTLLVVVNQGYDKVDSLQQNLAGVEFSPFFHVVDESGNPITVKGEDFESDRLVKGEYPDYRIGVTHDIVNYERDKKNRVSKLIIKKR